MLLNIITFLQSNVYMQILECFDMSGEYSSACYDILGEYSSYKLLSLHRSQWTTNLGAELLRISAKCIHVSSLSLCTTIYELYRCANKKQSTLNVTVFQQWYDGFEPNFQNDMVQRYNSLNLCRTQHIPWITFCQKLQIHFYNTLLLRRCKLFNGSCFFYWRSLYISLFIVHSMHDIAFYKQSEKICSQINYISGGWCKALTHFTWG